MVAHHQHVEMLVDGVARERPRRVGRGRQHVLQAGDLDDVRRVAAAGALGVEGMDGAALEGFYGVLDEAGFVQRVGMQHHLDVVIVGDAEAVIDRRRRGAPVLVQFQRAGAALDHLDQCSRARGVALARDTEIDRKRVERLDHPPHVPRAGRAGGRERAVRRPGAAAEHRGDARHQRVLDLLRADEMDVAVETARGEDLALACNDVGAGADHDGDAGLDIRVAGLADRSDHALLDRDVGLDDAPVIDDQRIGDDGVGRALPVGDLRLPHAVADHLAAAELHLLAVNGEILLDLDDEIGIGQPHLVAGGGPEHVGIDGTFDFGRHEEFLISGDAGSRPCVSNSSCSFSLAILYPASRRRSMPVAEKSRKAPESSDSSDKPASAIRTGSARSMSVICVEHLEALAPTTRSLSCGSSESSREQRPRDRRLSAAACLMVRAFSLILAKPVAVAQLGQAIIDLDHIFRRRAFLPKQIYHDQNTINIIRSGKRIDRVAERRVVDDTAIPETCAIDRDGRKPGRQTAARQHMARPNLHLCFILARMIAETDQLAGGHIDRGDDKSWSCWHSTKRNRHAFSAFRALDRCRRN